MSRLPTTALAALILLAACGKSPPAAPPAGGSGGADDSALSDDERLGYNPAVLLTCDARQAILSAELVTSAAQYDAIAAEIAGSDDPLVVRVLDEEGYSLYNTRAMRLVADESDPQPEPDRDLVAIVKRPTRLFCVAEAAEFFGSGDMTVERSPGNINPQGRCGAAEVVSLTVRRNADEPVVVDMVGDCHFAQERVIKVTLNLATGTLAKETEPAPDAVAEEE